MKPASLHAIHRLSAIAFAAVFALFFVFLAYLYAAFGDLLIGSVKARQEQTLLTNLNLQRFEAAVARLEKRQALPDPDPNLPNPFGLPPEQR